jgi:glycosyltransferase involved in cell wall biosynthesis
VLSVHGGDLFDPSKSSSPHRHAPLRAAVRSMLRNADEVIGQSRDTVRHVREIYGVDRSVGLIPLGIERPPVVPAPSRASLGVPDEAFVMITIGRLVARKATTQLVDVLARSGLSDAYLVVVGDGPDSAAVAQRALELGVRDRVRLLGQVTERQKYEALAAADVFVSTSQHEGFGLVFLEAMAFGLPVVCYDRGGQTDFLATGATGHVARLNDVEEFTRAVVGLHANAGLRSACGERNLRLVESYFIDACAARYEAVFESAIGRGSVRAAGSVVPHS